MAGNCLLPEQILFSAGSRAGARTACRRFLCSHADLAVRPQLRSNRGNALVASREEHAAAYLQHHIHAQPAFEFFLRFFQKPLEKIPIARLVVHTCYDSPVLAPEDMLLRARGGREAREDQVSGFHYDCLLSRPQPEVALRQGVQDANGAASRTTSAPVPGAGAASKANGQAGEAELRNKSTALDGAKATNTKKADKQEGPEATAGSSHSDTGSATSSDDGAASEMSSSESEAEEGLRLAATETVAVESRKAWETKEDAGLREASAVAALLREEPCCPPSGKRERESFTDMSSGTRLPAAHCAFKGCVFVSEKPACESWLQPAQYWSAAAGRWEQAKTRAGADCCGDSQCLWEHVLQQHGEVLHAERGKRLALSLYVAAIAERERRKMPHVGYSVDRRVLTHLSVMQRQAETKGLICALCAQICLQGAGRASQIGTATVAVVFEEMPEAVFRENWCYKTYVDRYATCGPMANADCTRSWSWRRRIVGRRYDGREVVCCPEDEECDAKHSDTEWCLACRIPLCVKCRAHGSKRAIPAALSNDNLLGYPPAFLYSLKVRYIEAAAASPLFTACVSFYIENDYGHLLEEELRAAKNSVAVRGSITSLEMPWPAIMDQFLENVSRDPADYLPHSPEILARMVFLHLRVAHAKEVAEWLPCTRALMSSSGRERLLHRLRARVETLYPEEEQHLPLEQRQGRTPAVILERARVQEIGRGDPGEAGTVVGSMEGSETWNGSMFTSSIRADVAGADRTRGARVEEQVREAQSLGKYQRLFVATNSKFVDQWQPRYVSHAFPFSLPRAVSGPDFPQRERDRRVSEAAQLSPKEFLRSLPARVEDSIRNDWNLVPAVRRVTSMWEVVCNNRVFVPAFKVGNISAAEQAERTVNAARSLYKRLTRGKWHDGKRLRPVKGDTSKLSLCKDLSTVEQHLVRNMRLRSQNLPGTQEVRRVIGQCLLGARIEFGPPLFITISPGARHSGLVMRLSRYRQEDPAVEEEQRAWIGADTPSLWAGSEHVNVDLPTYKMRRNVTCRDPWSVTQAFTCSIRFLLSVLLGTRACEHCGLASKCHCVDTYG